MKKNAKRSSCYSEKNTTTAPHDDSLVWIVRCGKYIALVPKAEETD